MTASFLTFSYPIKIERAKAFLSKIMGTHNFLETVIRLYIPASVQLYLAKPAGQLL
jgi:hypothetical protein